jgi:hypothetical protein
MANLFNVSDCDRLKGASNFIPLEIGAKLITESMIGSKLATDGSIEEYRDRVVIFSQKEGLGLIDTLAPLTTGFPWREGVKLVESFASVARGISF